MIRLFLGAIVVITIRFLCASLSLDLRVAFALTTQDFLVIPVTVIYIYRMYYLTFQGLHHSSSSETSSSGRSAFYLDGHGNDAR